MPVGMNLWRVSHSVMEALFCGAWGGPGNLQMQERLDPEETLAWESSGAIRASFQMEIWPFCASSKCCRISLQPAASLKEPCCWIALPLENDAHSLFFFFAPWMPCQVAHTHVWQGSTSHHVLVMSNSRFPISSEWHRYSQLEGLGKEVLLAALSSSGASSAHMKRVFPKAPTLTWNTSWVWSLASARTPGSLGDQGA